MYKAFSFCHFPMRYHYIPRTVRKQTYGRTYICSHPVYSRCTLYEVGGKGLAVIQQRFDPETKATCWTEIDAELQDDIYLNSGFLAYFETHGSEPADDIYPTVTLRQIMWALRMKPLPKKRWETVFDRKDI